MTTEAIKDLISTELAYFLFNENSLPEEIKIEVRYGHSIARLVIDGDRLRKFSNKAG